MRGCYTLPFLESVGVVRNIDLKQVVFGYRLLNFSNAECQCSSCLYPLSRENLPNRHIKCIHVGVVPPHPLHQFVIPFYISYVA